MFLYVLGGGLCNRVSAFPPIEIYCTAILSHGDVLLIKLVKRQQLGRTVLSQR